jgi:hypothetical protein
LEKKINELKDDQDSLRQELNIANKNIFEMKYPNGKIGTYWKFDMFGTRYYLKYKYVYDDDMKVGYIDSEYNNNDYMVYIHNEDNVVFFKITNKKNVDYYSLNKKDGGVCEISSSIFEGKINWNSMKVE